MKYKAIEISTSGNRWRDTPRQRNIYPFLTNYQTYNLNELKLLEDKNTFVYIPR